MLFGKSGFIATLFLIFIAQVPSQIESSFQRTGAQGAQSGVVQSPVATPKPWLDHWRLSTFSFGRVSRDQRQREFFEVVGTGITVRTDPHTGYIVTAKHIFDDPSKDWHPSELRVRWAWQEQKSVYEDLGSVLKLRDSNGRDLWMAATDGSDIAAIPASPQDVGGTHSQESIDVKDLARPDDLYEGGTVIVLGYPGIVGNEYLVRAIVRAGVVAWRDPSDPADKPFLIDANIYPGNSGGPVIKVPVGLSVSGTVGLPALPSLLGIVSQAPGQMQDITLNVPGVVPPLQLHQMIPVGGTGVIVPASKISALLKSFAQR